MSIKSDMFSKFMGSLENTTESAYDLASTAVTQAGKEKQRQEQKEQLFKSDQDVLVSLYTKELGEKLKTLPDSIDIDSYGPEMDKFSNDFVSARRNEGVYTEEALGWLENTFIPSQKAQNEASVGEVQNYVTNSWLATRASSKASELAANPDMTVDQAYEEYKAYYESTRLANIPSGYGILLPETFREAIREPKAEQVFERLARDPENGYTYSSSFDKTAAMEQAKKETGYDPDYANNKSLATNCDKILKTIASERQTAATEAQSEITSKYMAMSLNGEDYNVDDIVNDAKDMGAIRPDGTVDRYWATFLAPYIEAIEKQRVVDEKTDQINSELGVIDGLSGEDVLNVAQQVSEGTFDFTPGTVKEGTASVNASGAKIPLPAKTGYGKPVTSEDGAVEGGMSQGIGAKGQPVPLKDFADHTSTPEASTEKPVFVEDYTPYAGTEEPQMSDELLSKVKELKSMAEETSFGNFFGEDGEMNYDNARGKHTYKFEGMPDVECNYTPVVKALCQKYGIEYDDSSYSVYYLAQAVNEMEAAGAFTSPKKANAVQRLASMRLDPEVTPSDYNTELLKYQSEGVLTDVEIRDYGLSKHAFDGKIDNQKYKDALSSAYDAAFYNLFGKEYSNKNVANLDDASSQWEDMARKLDRELTIMAQLHPEEFQNDPSKIVDDVVNRLTDTSLMQSLYNSVTSARGMTFVWNLGGFFSTGRVAEYTYNRIDETSTVSDFLEDFYADPQKYYRAGLMNDDIVAWVDTTLNADKSNLKDTGKKASKDNVEQVAQHFFGKSWSECTLEQKNQIMVSYTFGQTRVDFTKAVCKTFGYDIGDVNGHVMVAASDGFGGGMAVVTNDGRVFMSGGLPDGSGHQWIIGSVSDRTLKNIKENLKYGTGAVISYSEMSAYGTKTFSDANLAYDISGATLSTLGTKLGVPNVFENKMNRNKEYELVGIYESVQPDRYNLKQIRSN